MALMGLPNELLDVIVECTLPDGFESLVLTCKRLHQLCIPFLKHHNELRFRLRHFAYYLEPGGSIAAASDLITRIAAEPRIARYIRIADLGRDSRFLKHALARGERPRSVPAVDDGGAMIELFANSPYLQRAGLDWKVYYETFAQDVRETRYSQYGAAFLLTLLPATEELILPRSWRPDTATSQLLDTTVDEARRQGPLSPASSLSSLARFEGGASSFEREGISLSWMEPFLTLPHMRSFLGPSCMAFGESARSLGSR
jgi:hypothetical protein